MRVHTPNKRYKMSLRIRRMMAAQKGKCVCGEHIDGGAYKDWGKFLTCFKC